jgi:hypothetical protein
VVVSLTLARLVLTVYDGIAGVKSEIDEGIASSPPPPIKPLELAAPATRDFADLLNKCESKRCCTNEPERGARLQSAHNDWVKLRRAISAERPALEPAAEADNAPAWSATNCRARYPHLYWFAGRLV